MKKPKKFEIPKRLTQREVASLLDVSPMYLNDIINNRRDISLNLAFKLENLLGIDARKIMEAQLNDKIEAFRQKQRLLENTSDNNG